MTATEITVSMDYTRAKIEMGKRDLQTHDELLAALKTEFKINENAGEKLTLVVRKQRTKRKDERRSPKKDV